METIGNSSSSQLFSRNLGWVTEQEQTSISSMHVGLIGLGGVGGQYAEILARLGVGEFTISDPDYFSEENTNRQNECRVSNYGKNKAEVISRLIQDINPKAKVHIIAGGMTKEKVPAFCQAIDYYLDSLDFFEIDLRIQIFRKMRELGKPALTVAPLGTGAALLVFTKDSMSFDDYFGLHLTTDLAERSYRFLLGLSPSVPHRKYLQERNRVDFNKRKVPSMPMGVYSCASVAATTLLKLQLQRGSVKTAPWSIHYDPYLGVIKKRYVWMGHRNPLQKLKLLFLKKFVQS